MINGRRLGLRIFIIFLALEIIYLWMVKCLEVYFLPLLPYTFKFFVVHCGASGSSLANLRQRVAIFGSPPPLDVTWRTQGTQNSREQQRLGRASSSWCLLSFTVKNPQIHNNHGCTTTINWFRRTCNESKITLYYWLHTMIIMQFTDPLSIHFPFFSFAFLFFGTCLFH